MRPTGPLWGWGSPLLARPVRPSKGVLLAPQLPLLGSIVTLPGSPGPSFAASQGPGVGWGGGAAPGGGHRGVGAIGRRCPRAFEDPRSAFCPGTPRKTPACLGFIAGVSQRKAGWGLDV